MQRHLLHPRMTLLILLILVCALLCAGSTAKEPEPTTHQHNGSASAFSLTPPGPGAHTLVSVQIVSRHGTRAPNPVVSQICPSDRANLARYGDLRLTLAGLTGTGQKELYALGVFTRQTYIERSYRHFISDYFNDEEVYFRAVGEDRTIQSAVCMGQGMYPAGTAAIGYFTDLPSPVPVYTLPDEMDSLLEVRKHDCARKLKEDGAAWDKTEGIELYRANTDLIERIIQICNISSLNDVIDGSGDNYGDAIKDITDAMTFDMIEGFPLQDGLNVSSLLEFRAMAVTQLLGRIIGTEEQIVYMNGQLPERLATNFMQNVASQGPLPAMAHHLKMYAYHGHREMMYALGAFLGIEFDIKFPGLPKGAIPPATTLFFELHYTGEGRDEKTGAPPNPWIQNGQENPYQHRMVEPEDMPPKKRKWGTLEVNTAAPAATQATTQQADAQKKQDRPASATPSTVRQNAQSTTLSSTASASSPASSSSPSQAEAEAQQSALLHPVQQSYPASPNEADAASAAAESSSSSSQHHKRMVRRLLQTNTPNRTGENELNGHHPRKHSDEEILPRDETAGGKKSSLVKIPDALMPDPPMNGYVVRAFLWHPCGDASIQERPTETKEAHRAHAADCPAVPVKMSAICDGYECTLEDFRTKMEQRVQRVGTWDKLCGVAGPVKTITADVTAVQQDDVSLVDTRAASSSTKTPRHSRLHVMRWIFLIGVCALIYLGVVKYRAHQRSTSRGSPEEYISFTGTSTEERTPLTRVF